MSILAEISGFFAESGLERTLCFQAALTGCDFKSHWRALTVPAKQMQRLMHSVWSQVDQSGRGVLTPADINGFLAGLGLGPTGSDVRHIIDELDWSSSGIVSRCSHCLSLCSPSVSIVSQVD